MKRAGRYRFKPTGGIGKRRVFVPQWRHRQRPQLASSGHAGRGSPNGGADARWICLVMRSSSAPGDVLPSLSAAAGEQARSQHVPSAARIEPPVAARKPVRLRNHGIVRVDNYAWLRDKNWREVVQDPSRLAPAIRAYLDGRKQICRRHPGAAGRPARQTGGGDEGTHSAAGHPACRCPTARMRTGANMWPAPSMSCIVRAPRDGGDEEVLVDGNVLAQGQTYFAFGDPAPQSEPPLLCLC